MEKTTAKGTFFDTMIGMNTPDYSRYSSYDEAIATKTNAIEKAWENYRHAKEDLEPMDVQRKFLDVALESQNNWRQFNILLERHFGEPLTLKKCEIIAVTMATIPAELRDEELDSFFRMCDKVTQGRKGANGKYYDCGRFSSLVSFYRFKQTVITMSPLLNDYDLFQQLRKEFGL